MEILLTVVIFMFLGMLIASLLTGLFGWLFLTSSIILAASLAIIVYFLPLLIASARRHPHTLPIALINIFLGWCPLFWIISLVWAMDWYTLIKKWLKNSPNEIKDETVVEAKYQ